MIDLLLYEALLSLAILLACRRFPAARLAITLAAGSALATTACVISLYCREPRFTRVAWPSPAATAGLAGAGLVTRVGDNAVGSLGSLLATAAANPALPLDASRPVPRRGARPSEPFWGSWDSYSLGEISAGLELFQRHPVYRQYGHALALQNHPEVQIPGVRIVEAQGVPTASLADLEKAIGQMPRDGVANLLVMSPTPDGGTRNIYYSPKSLEAPEPASGWTGWQLIQYQLGFSGTQFLIDYRRDGRFGRFHYFDDENFEYSGPDAISARFEAGHPPKYQQFGADVTALVIPRLRLLPRLFANPLVTVLAAVPGTYLRQVFALPGLYHLYVFRSFLPTQYYKLDDGLDVSAWLFRLSSLLGSLALASLALFAFSRRYPEARRTGIALFTLVALALQLVDLFQLRVF